LVTGFNNTFKHRLQCTGHTFTLIQARYHIAAWPVPFTYCLALCMTFAAYRADCIL
jgi:hypothetical protein